MAGRKSSWQQEDFRDKELDKTTTSEPNQSNSVEDDFASLLLPMLAAGEDSLLLPTKPIEEPRQDDMYQSQRPKQQFARYSDLDEITNSSRQWEPGSGGGSNHEYLTEEDFLCHYASLRRPERSSLANIYGETGYYNLSHPVAPTTFYEPYHNQGAQAHAPIQSLEGHVTPGYQGYYPRESRNYPPRGYPAQVSGNYDVAAEDHYSGLNQGKILDPSRSRWSRQPSQSLSGFSGPGLHERRNFELSPAVGSSEDHSESNYPHAVPTNVEGETRISSHASYNGDDKLDENMDFLQFQKPELDVVSVGTRSSRGPIDISAKLSGNFFLEVREKENVSGVEVKKQVSSRLTCYRRNYIQVSANFFGLDSLETVQYESSAELSEDGALKRRPHERRTGRVKKLFATLSGETDVAKRNVKLIYAPPKQSDLAEAAEYLPPRLFLEPNLANQTIAWRRLQFRTATANNVRQSTQQHFSIRLCLWAKMDSGDEVILLTSVSQPIIVRGRNPKFYSKCKDIPLSETRIAEPSRINDSSSYDQKVDLSETSRKRTSESLPPSSTNPGPSVSNIRDNNRGENDDSDMSYEKSIVGVTKPKSEDASESVASAEIGEQDNYRFFPISTGYGMPPVEVVYHPHAVHHPRLLSMDQAEVQKATSPIETNRVKRYFVAV